MGNELVKLCLSEEILKVEQKVESLFIRNTRERIVRILALQINDEFSKLVLISKMLDGVSQRLPTNNGREVTIGFAMNSGQDPSL